MDIRAVAAEAKCEDAYWLESPSGEWVGCDEFCLTCAKKRATKHARQLRGPLQFDECDGPRFCARCGVMLAYVLTAYGVDSEMEHFLAHGVPVPLTPDVAYQLQAIEDQLPYMQKAWG